MGQLKTLKELGFEVIPIEKLVKADWNYKKDDGEKKKKLNANFKRNGQLENLIVRKLDTGFFEVCNGNHRLDSLEELGFSFAVVKNMGKISRAHAIRIAVETNETRFEVDQIRLAEAIGEISEEYNLKDLESTTIFKLDELEDYKKLLEFDWEQFKEDGELPEIKPKSSIIAKCPKCGEKFEVN